MVVEAAGATKAPGEAGAALKVVRGVAETAADCWDVTGTAEKATVVAAGAAEAKVERSEAAGVAG